MNQIEKAIAFATKAHAGQFRKGTDRPYILHAIETMIIAMRLYLDDDAIAAAVLHDVVENTSVTLRRIEKEFGPRVADLVDSVTEDKMKKLPPEATWRARKWQMIFRLRKADRDTLGICLADNLSNLRELNRDYEIIGDEIWERFNQKEMKFGSDSTRRTRLCRPGTTRRSGILSNKNMNTNTMRKWKNTPI